MSIQEDFVSFPTLGERNGDATGQVGVRVICPLIMINISTNNISDKIAKTSNVAPAA